MGKKFHTEVSHFAEMDEFLNYLARGEDAELLFYMKVDFDDEAKQWRAGFFPALGCSEGIIGSYGKGPEDAISRAGKLLATTMALSRKEVLGE